MNKLLEEQAKLQDAIDANERLGTRTQARDRRRRAAPAALGGDASSKLSGGEKRRVALCRLLLSKPDMLLLDEPTNHLDAESVAWLERFLEEYPSTVIAVTHDRYFLDNVAELDPGTRPRPRHSLGRQLFLLAGAEGEAPGARGARAGLAAQDAGQANSNGCAQNPKARQAKSKARLRASRNCESKEFQERNETNEIYIPPGPRLGDLVIEAKGLRKAFGDRLLIDDLSFNLPPGGIVGIIGPNGAGKTTLFRMLTGVEKPDARRDPHRRHRASWPTSTSRARRSNDKKTVWQEISGGLDIIKVGNYETPSRAYVGRFNFKGTQQQQLIGELSGGERNRVHLAKVLKSGGNVLLLDEPTNDLDVETLRALEEALLDFPGCAVVISHDRWFLDRIATHILAFEGDSQVVWFEGNYQDYIEDLQAPSRRGCRPAAPAQVPPLTG